jgi:hypothetical protein
VQHSQFSVIQFDGRRDGLQRIERGEVVQGAFVDGAFEASVGDDRRSEASVGIEAGERLVEMSELALLTGDRFATAVKPLLNAVDVGLRSNDADPD